MKNIILIFVVLLFVAGCAMTGQQAEQLGDQLGQIFEKVADIASKPIPPANVAVKTAGGLGVWEWLGGVAMSVAIATGAVKITDKKKGKK